MRRLKILHVEANREDARLLARACRVADLQADFFEVSDGPAAVAFLRGEPPFRNCGENPFPDLVILDLNLPGMNGFELLQWIRRESRCTTLPVLVFTHSAQQEDKARAIADGASGFFVKPMEFSSLVQLAESFKRFGRIESN